MRAVLGLTTKINTPPFGDNTRKISLYVIKGNGEITTSNEPFLKYRLVGLQMKNTALAADGFRIILHLTCRKLCTVKPFFNILRLLRIGEDAKPDADKIILISLRSLSLAE